MSPDLDLEDNDNCHLTAWNPIKPSAFTSLSISLGGWMIKKYDYSYNGKLLGGEWLKTITIIIIAISLGEYTIKNFN